MKSPGGSGPGRGRKERHDERLAAVSALGRALTRRAGSRCELCGPDGVEPLRVIEVPPVEDEPSVDAAILACARCRDLIEGGRLPDNPAELRFLEGAVWSETLPVQLAAVRLLRALSARGVSWATETLDGLWLPEEVEARL